VNTLLLAVMALVVGKSPTAALSLLGSITMTQWFGIGGDVIKAIPDVVQIMQSLPKPMTARRPTTRIRPEDRLAFERQDRSIADQL
jgi:hypothetical protein